jgi:hypothetical protein
MLAESTQQHSSKASYSGNLEPKSNLSQFKNLNKETEDGIHGVLLIAITGQDESPTW